MPILQKPQSTTSPPPSGENGQPANPDEPVDPTATPEPVDPTESAVEPTNDFLNFFFDEGDPEPEPAPAPVEPKILNRPTVQQPKQYTMEQIQKDPAAFESYLAEREGVMREELTQQLSEQLLRNANAIITNQVVRGIAYAREADKFWEKNQDLAPVAETFNKIVDKLSRKNTKLKPAELYAQAGKVIRSALTKTGRQQPNSTVPAPPAAQPKRNGATEKDPRTLKMRSLFKMGN